MANWVVRTEKTARRMWKLGYSGRSGVGGINAISPPTTSLSSIRSARSKFSTANRRLLGSGDNKVSGVFPASLRCFCSFAAHPTTVQHHQEDGGESVPEPERSTFPVLVVPRPKNQTGEEVVEDGKDEKYYYYFHLPDFEEDESSEDEEEKPYSWPKVRKIKKNKIPDVPDYDLAQCVGSSHGWLAFMDPNNSSINFVNPLIHSDHIRTSFWIPPIPSGGSANNLDVPFVKKVALSSGPYENSYTKAAIHGPRRHLAFYKHKDGTWWTPGGSDGFYSGVPFVQKVALSSPPCEDGYSAAAIHGPRCNLAFYKHEEGTWWTPGGVGDYSDVIYSKKDGFFYAIRNPQRNDKLTDYPIQAWDPFSHQSTVIHPSFRDPRSHTFEDDMWVGELDEKRYLVESSPSRGGGGGGGDLYLVLRYICKSVNERHTFDPIHAESYDPDLFITYETFFCKVYKLNRNYNGICCWVAVDDLDGQCFFVGMNHSFSVPDAHLHYPVLWQDCVYYSDDCFDKMHLSSNSGGHDNGAFQLGGLETAVVYNGDLSKYHPPPIWLDVLSQPALEKS